MFDRCQRSDLLVPACAHCRGKATPPDGYTEQVHELDTLRLNENGPGLTARRTVTLSARACGMCGEYVAAKEPAVLCEAGLCCERCQP